VLTVRSEQMVVREGSSRSRFAPSTLQRQGQMSPNLNIFSLALTPEFGRRSVREETQFLRFLGDFIFEDGRDPWQAAARGENVNKSERQTGEQAGTPSETPCLSAQTFDRPSGFGRAPGTKKQSHSHVLGKKRKAVALTFTTGLVRSQRSSMEERTTRKSLEQLEDVSMGRESMERTTRRHKGRRTGGGDRKRMSLRGQCFRRLTRSKPMSM
jgi:hypothetical protein